MGVLALAGNSCVLNPGGHWLADIPRNEWDLSEDDQKEALANWDEDVGDRGQEFVLIGRKFDQDAAKAQLESCLLNESEFSAGARKWRKLNDPFPAWS
jgi:hypothetical protein